MCVKFGESLQLRFSVLMNNANTQNEPKCFSWAVAVADISDIRFAEEAVPVHPELRDVKVGIRPLVIRGVDVPDEMRVMCVQGQDGETAYWYVVTWRGCEVAPRCIDAGSDDMAKALLLNELRKWSLADTSDG